MRIPWVLEERLSWPEFLAALERYCEGRGWELEFDTESDCSCAIVAYPEQREDSTDISPEYIQGELPF